MAGLNTHSKGVSLALFQLTPEEVREQRRKMGKEETVTVDLLNRAVSVKHTDEGLRARGLSAESPIHPESVQKYLESKFGDTLEDVSGATRKLAKSLPPSELAGKAYALYEKFKPDIPPGKKGWGAPPANSTLTSSERWLRPDPEERLLGHRTSVFDAAKSFRGVSTFNKGDMAKEIEPRQKRFTLL